MELIVETSGIEKIKSLVAAYPQRIRVSALRSANKTAIGLKTDIFKLIKTKYTVKQRAIRGAISSKKATKTDTTAVVLVEGKRIPLHEFKHKPTTIKKRPPRGITVFEKPGASEIIEGSFLAKLGNLHGSDFKIYKRKSQKRFPIRLLKGETVAELLENSDIEELKEKGKERCFR